MDTNHFRLPDLHVAQQMRRDKLRIHHDSIPVVHHSGGVYINSLEHHLPPQEGLNYEYCSEMMNFGGNRDGDNDLMLDQESDDKRSRINEAQSFGNFSRTIPTGDPHYFSIWKSIGSQSTTDNWVDDNQIPNFGGDSSLKEVKPYPCFQEVNSQSNNTSLYRNTLQELVTSSNVQAHPFPLELASIRQKETSQWGVGGGSELLLLPAYAATTDHQLRHKRCDLVTPDWVGGELSYVNTAQALSLSLSSVPSPKVHATQIAKKCSTTEFQSIQDSRDLLSGGSGSHGSTHMNHGPLGPFTGYATILRGSKFLKPAQQLLDELYCVARLKNGEIYEASHKIPEVVRVSNESADIVELSGKGIGDPGGGSGLPSLAFDDSSDKSGAEPVSLNCSSTVSSCLPDNIQKKAKLLFMQDEVCRMYRHYQQQMQMVVSSFESVAGLSGSTPYVSLALKMVSKHFRCLKNVISDQLKSIRNALGEDLSAGTSSSGKGKGDGVSMLKFYDQKQHLEGQHIWRPQRGLPERAVSILRSWLFDHFLHPYPTDSDKHMLANQTGLTRNQVSNWFINARVRVWKPMVEEIHTLETKGIGHLEKQAAEGSHCLSPSGCESLRVEHQVPSSGGGSLIMGLVPGMELGTVSLTLGLRRTMANDQR